MDLKCSLKDCSGHTQHTSPGCQLPGVRLSHSTCVPGKLTASGNPGTGGRGCQFTLVCQGACNILFISKARIWPGGRVGKFDTCVPPSYPKQSLRFCGTGIYASFAHCAIPHGYFPIAKLYEASSCPFLLTDTFPAPPSMQHIQVAKQKLTEQMTVEGSHVSVCLPCTMPLFSFLVSYSSFFSQTLNYLQLALTF